MFPMFCPLLIYSDLRMSIMKSRKHRSADQEITSTKKIMTAWSELLFDQIHFQAGHSWRLTASTTCLNPSISVLIIIIFEHDAMRTHSHVPKVIPEYLVSAYDRAASENMISPELVMYKAR